LGFQTRESLLYNEGISPEYLSAIKNAKARCHMYAEEQLFGKTQVAGVIFNLKNNYAWQDRTTTEHLIPAGMNINMNDDRARKNRDRLLAETEKGQLV